MPYRVVTATYPTEKAKEVLEKMSDIIKKYPRDETIATRVLPAIAKTTKQGLKSIAVSDVKEGRLEEALTRAGKRMAMLNDIEGLEYSIDVYMSLRELREAFGIIMPE
jgi:hypothetical protein